MNNKITIIEGPTPTFEIASTDWSSAMVEAPDSYEVVLTNLRTMNGPGLIERCQQTWNQQDTMYLQYRNTIGMEQEVPIVAARCMDTDEGQKLVLWVRIKPEQIKLEVRRDDEED
jgi:hypothetical protein